MANIIILSIYIISTLGDSLPDISTGAGPDIFSKRDTPKETSPGVFNGWTTYVNTLHNIKETITNKATSIKDNVKETITEKATSIKDNIGSSINDGINIWTSTIESITNILWIIYIAIIICSALFIIGLIADSVAKIFESYHRICVVRDGLK